MTGKKCRKKVKRGKGVLKGVEKAKGRGRWEDGMVKRRVSVILSLAAGWHAGPNEGLWYLLLKCVQLDAFSGVGSQKKTFHYGF